MKYINMFISDIVNEMANLYPTKTGIDEVLMFVGPVKQHWHRVKISNIPNKYSSNNFIISIPDLIIVEGIPEKWVKKKLPLIFEFIKNNEQLIIDFSENKILSEDFIDSIKKIGDVEQI